LKRKREVMKKVDGKRRQDVGTTQILSRWGRGSKRKKTTGDDQEERMYMLKPSLGVGGEKKKVKPGETLKRAHLSTRRGKGKGS